MSVRRIAKLAKVSPATVSMVLRNNPRISAATTRRVLKIAKSLGYRPDAKVAELMRYLGQSRRPHNEACFGVISFYDNARPWEQSLHIMRVYEGMTNRATALGYRLEPFWLRAPGMTYSRIRSILDTRGIQGLLCLGSPKMDEEFPAGLDHYAVVTQGLSIRTPLHRIINDAYNDTLRVLDRVYQSGARRPGLVLGNYEDVRGGHANLSAYCGWCQQMFGTPLVMPVLQLNRVEEPVLLAWRKRHRPDVIIVVHVHEMLEDLIAVLRMHEVGYRPHELGVVALSQGLQGTGLSGLEENGALIGEWAVEMLIGRIMSRDFGLPVHPRIEMVEGQWIDGKSFRRQGG